MSAERLDPLIDRLFEGRATAVARDLKLNLKKLLDDGALAPSDATLTLVALAAALRSPALHELALARAEVLALAADDVQEAREAAAIMGMLNKYYRFRHFIEAGQGKEALQTGFRSAGLRMNALSKPALGKQRFEMLALAVSVVNGCEVCVNAHERELRQHGVDGEQVHDLARLAAVASGVATLLA